MTEVKDRERKGVSGEKRARALTTLSIRDTVAPSSVPRLCQPRPTVAPPRSEPDSLDKRRRVEATTSPVTEQAVVVPTTKGIVTSGDGGGGGGEHNGEVKGDPPPLSSNALSSSALSSSAVSSSSTLTTPQVGTLALRDPLRLVHGKSLFDAPST